MLPIGVVWVMVEMGFDADPVRNEFFRENPKTWGLVGTNILECARQLLTHALLGAAHLAPSISAHWIAIGLW